MILQAKTVKANAGYVRTDKVIKITQKGMSDLNKSIEKSIKKNEIKREKGLEIAARCRME